MLGFAALGLLSMNHFPTLVTWSVQSSRFMAGFMGLLTIGLEVSDALSEIPRQPRGTESARKPHGRGMPVSSDCTS